VNYDLLRKLGNYGLIANTLFGQFVNLQMSLVVSAVLGLISIPYYAKTKVWDTVVFISFIITVNVISAMKGVPGCSPG
jgi:hypothetical protein